jgi:hypothetical protein
MFTWADLWVGIALPAAVTAGLLVAGWRVAHRRLSARDGRSWVGPAAVAAGFVAGYALLLGWPELPPLDAIDWLFFVTPALAVVGLWQVWREVDLAGRATSIIVVLGAVLLLVAWPVVTSDHRWAHSARLELQIASVMAIAALVPLDALAYRVSAARLYTILLAMAGPAAITLLLSGSQRIGQIGGLLAACAAGGLAASLLLGRAAVARGTIVVFGVLLAGLVWCGRLYAELAAGNALLLAAAPNAAWLGYLVPDRAGWLPRVLVQLGAVVAVATIAVVRAWLVFVEQAE